MTPALFAASAVAAPASGNKKDRPKGGHERNDTMSDIESVNESLFESIKHVNEYGQEYWTARELQPVLEYVEWRKFKASIVKAMDACETSNGKVSDHFVGAAKMVQLGSGAKREVEDFHLSRYACYLIAMNGDPRKKAIALAQTYFAVKTRQQELIENYESLTDDQKRAEKEIAQGRMSVTVHTSPHPATKKDRPQAAVSISVVYM